MNVKKIGAEAAIFGALAVTGFGIGAGAANADQQVPNSPNIVWKLDPGHGRGHGGEGGDWDGNWDGWRGNPGYYYGGNCAWVPPAVSAWVPPAVC